MFQILVKDNSVPEMTGTTTIRVNLIPDNEYPPTIISEPGTAVITVEL